MIEIRIGGVPEHFNLPWYLALEDGSFEKENIFLRWQDYSSGTGAMCRDLRDSKLDMAILLTEGIVSDIVNGNPSKILQWYVRSSLIWGIHVSSHTGIHEVEQIKGLKYAISRKGSGSHLMALVDAYLRGWPIENNNFIETGNIHGAVAALKEGSADIFFWEKYMTQPYVDTDELRRVGERLTPWPCFAIATTEYAWMKFPDVIKKISAIIIKSSVSFMAQPDAVDLISQRFQLQWEDASQWFSKTKWAIDHHIFPDEISGVMDVLQAIGFIKEKSKANEILAF